MNNLRSAYSSLIRHATQQTARHDTPNKNIVSKYKVSVLYLSQYFNHSAKHVKKKHKSFRKLALLLLHKGSNFCIQDIFQQCKRIIQHQNEDTAEHKYNCYVSSKYSFVNAISQFFRITNKIYFLFLVKLKKIENKNKSKLNEFLVQFIVNIAPARQRRQIIWHLINSLSTGCTYGSNEL